MRGVISVTIKGDDDLQIGTALTTKVQGPAATVEYQWYRGANATGDAWTAIPGATEAGYTATEADAGYYLKVVATGVGEYAGSVEDVTANPVYTERLVVSTDSPALGERVTATVVPGDYSRSISGASSTRTETRPRLPMRRSPTSRPATTTSATGSR